MPPDRGKRPALLGVNDSHDQVGSRSRADISLVLLRSSSEGEMRARCMLTCSDQRVDSDIICMFALKLLVSNNRTQPNDEHLPSRTRHSSNTCSRGTSKQAKNCISVSKILLRVEKAVWKLRKFRSLLVLYST